MQILSELGRPTRWYSKLIAALLALSFFTWRTLTRDGGLKQGDAVAAMVHAIACSK